MSSVALAPGVKGAAGEAVPCSSWDSGPRCGDSPIEAHDGQRLGSIGNECPANRRKGTRSWARAQLA